MGQPTKASPIMGRWRRSGPPHSLARLSHSFVPNPNPLATPWRWRRRHGRRHAPAISVLPCHSHLPNRDRRETIYRSVRVVSPISSSPGESPLSGSRGESPLAIDDLRRALVLVDDVCAPETDLAQVLLAVLVPSSLVLCCGGVFVFAGVTSAPTLALQLLWPREHCLAMP
jgi:hypothetical protein